MENILKQITPETHDTLSNTDTNSFDKNIERLRRDDIISDEMKDAINNLSRDVQVTAEKRDSDAEENKKFSVVKVPDATVNKNNQTASKLSTIPSNSINSEGSGSGSDSESGSGSDSGSGDAETESTLSEKQSPTNNMMSTNDAALAMNIEDNDDTSGSGSGDEASGEIDTNASKRNMMENPPAIQNQTQNEVVPSNNATAQRITVEVPVNALVTNNISQATTENPGGFNQAPLTKTQSTKSDGNATLTEIKYFKAQENTTEVIDRVNNNNTTKINQNTTFAKLLNNAADAGNATKPSSSKRDSLPDEVSNVADNLFNFENDDEGKSPATASAAAGNTESADDNLPGSQGGPIAEDLMSSMTSPSSAEKKSAVSNATATQKSSPMKIDQQKGESKKKWQVVNSSEAASGSGGIPDDEIKMQVESSIGKTFDASMKKISDNMEAELLPGDYGDDSLSLSDLSGSGSGTESGDDQESGSGAESDSLDSSAPSKKTSMIKPKSSSVVEPENEVSDESGDSESGSGSGASGSGSGDFDTLLSPTNQNEASTENAESSPFGLHAIEATSSDSKKQAGVKQFRHNMTMPSPKNTTFRNNLFDDTEDTQSFLGESDASDESGSGEGESGDDASGDTAESGAGEDEETTAAILKPKDKVEENPFAKDQVTGQSPQPQPKPQPEAITQAKDTSGEYSL